MMKLLVLAALVGATTAATQAQKDALTAANAAVANSDVCKDDEWSYLCNTDAWAGAADAVTGGQELQTAALRRALDHTIKHTECAAGDATCASTKAIVDAQLLDIPKVVNSNRLAQVHDDAGLIHPANNQNGLTADKTSLVYSGDVMTLTTNAGADYIDDVTLVKFVKSTDHCDSSLSGDKDVRSTAHVLSVDGSPSNCVGGKDAGTAAEDNQFHLCQSKKGQGRKACQAAGCTYTPPAKVGIGFAYSSLTALGVNALKSPATATWRLCMTSPSIADNTVFADTGILVSAKCADAKLAFKGNDCVCAANKGTPDPTGADPQHCVECPQGKNSVLGGLCTVCKAGTYGEGAGKGCTACTVGTYGVEQDGLTVPGDGKEADMCKSCPEGTYNDQPGMPNFSDCNNCGKNGFAKHGLTKVTKQTSWSAVCVPECAANDDKKAVYGLRVNEGAAISQTLAEQQAEAIKLGYGTYAGKTGDFDQCVEFADCKKDFGLVADPMTKLCLKACSPGWMDDGNGLCEPVECAAKTHRAINGACVACPAGTESATKSFTYAKIGQTDAATPIDTKDKASVNAPLYAAAKAVTTFCVDKFCAKK